MDWDRFVPPLELIRWTGSNDWTSFRATGAEFFGYCRDLAGIRANAAVLDVGCGCGRMALPMLDYLESSGRYDGIDVDPRSITWATENITKARGAFRFHHANIFNHTYNAAGKIPPYRYRFPFADSTFDFVLATSVFTHLLPPGLHNYLLEINRVLKIGGKALTTFFLLNDDAAQRIRQGHSQFQFPHQWGDCAVQSIEDPESVIGYDEASINQLMHSRGLEICGHMNPGSWSGRRDVRHFQDLVVVRKVRHVPGIIRWVRQGAFVSLSATTILTESALRRGGVIQLKLI